MDNSATPIVSEQDASATGAKRVRLDALMACGILALVAVIDSVPRLMAIGS